MGTIGSCAIPKNNSYVGDKSDLNPVRPHNPPKVFSLLDLGIDEAVFRGLLKDSFNKLNWDFYDKKALEINYLKDKLPGYQEALEKFSIHYFSGEKSLYNISSIVSQLPSSEIKKFRAIRPFRKRAISRFVIEKESKGWRLCREDSSCFTQPGNNKNCFSNIGRVFPPMCSQVTSHPLFSHLLHQLANMVYERNNPPSYVVQQSPAIKYR